MSPTTHDLKNVGPGHYEICIKEPISEKWLAGFDEFTIARTESGETLLTGPAADRSALHGLLPKIRDLNLTLLTVNRFDLKHPREKEYQWSQHGSGETMYRSSS